MRTQVVKARPLLTSQGIRVADFHADDHWHNLAWDLAGDPRHDPVHGILAEVGRKAAAANVSILLLMSEEFEHPLRTVAGVAELVAFADSLGARPTVVMAFRHQVEYVSVR